MELRVTFDPSADAAYIYLRNPKPGSVDETVMCEELFVNLDLDIFGKLVGIELLNASKLLPREILDAAVRPESEPSDH